MKEELMAECDKSVHLLLEKLKEINQSAALGDSDVKVLHSIYETLLHIQTIKRM